MQIFLHHIVLFWVATTCANPLSRSAISKRDRDFDSIRKSYRGIYWDDAFKTCPPEALNVLVEATRMAIVMTNYRTAPQYDLFWLSPAWNRFFVTDNSISKREGMWRSDGHRWVFNGMMNVFQQIKKFPVKGRARDNGEFTRARQMAYRCKEDVYRKCDGRVYVDFIHEMPF